MIHPLQYELASARHTDCQDRAARQRLVAEAEHQATRRTRSTPIFRTIAARMHGYVSTAIRIEAFSHAEIE